MPTHNDISIIPGRPADYTSLARFHYRAPKPATCVHTLTATDTASGELIGVLTISMPTLNAPWRPAAWPRLFAHADKRKAAARVNRHLRTISRVIIDPRYRALRIARRLVETYLAAPLTRCTEAVAAMGRWCPFFLNAGMREAPMPTSRRELVLSNVLRRLGLEAWELADVDRAASAVRASDELCTALMKWAAYSRATRRHLIGIERESESFAALAVLAGASLTARPLVYVSGQ
jgi:hypothetical protein